MSCCRSADIAEPAQQSAAASSNKPIASTKNDNMSDAKVQPKIAIVYYSTYGHIATMAEAVAKGAKEAGGDVKIFQIAETLPKEVLEKMHAPPKKDHPIIDPHELEHFDAIIFGVPTRFGAAASQVKGLWDATGALWQKGALVGKIGSVFFSTATQGGGQETTALTFYTNLVHHGMLIAPIGYSDPRLFDNTQVHGGSPYGAGTLSGGDGSRQPSALELGVAEHQGKLVTGYATKFKKGSQ